MTGYNPPVPQNGDRQAPQALPGRRLCPPRGSMSYSVLVPIGLAGILALLYALYLITWVLRQPPGTEEMKTIARAIQEGAQAYLNRQYSIIAAIGVLIAVLLLVLQGLALGWQTGIQTAVLFVIGAALSAAAGYVGMNISVRSNLRTAQAATGGLEPALRVAFRGGAVTGFFVVGFGLAGVVIAIAYKPAVDNLKSALFIFPLSYDGSYLGTLVALLLAAGVALGAFGSYLGVRRFLAV